VSDAGRTLDPAAVSRIRKGLLKRGVPTEEIDAALATGRIGLLAIDVAVIAGTPRFNRQAVAERTGVPFEVLDRLWLALGFPPADGEVIFTDSDVEAVKTLHRLLQSKLIDEETAVQFARVLGSAMSRVAEALVSAQPGMRPNEQEQLAYAEAVLPSRGSIIDETARLIDYTWRRHLQASARRAMITDPGEEGGVVQTVGFADLVGYTALSQQLSEDALSAVVDRFEELAYDVVAGAGGRVVKTIGDEVMFVVGDPVTAIHLALALSDAYADDDLLSEVRVALASGPVLAKDGDYFGPVVNLASRLVAVAYPGTVLVSSDIHDALADEAGLAWRELRPRRLKDIGTVPIWAVYREGEKSPPGATRRRFGPLRTLLAEAHMQRGDRKAIDTAVEQLIQASELGEAEARSSDTSGEPAPVSPDVSDDDRSPRDGRGDRPGGRGSRRH
jgi:adenylate cyclase